MGAEDFRITLFASGRIDRILSKLLPLPHVRSIESQDDPHGQQVYLLYDDGEHVFECEARPEGQARARISLRFAICHPTSVDDAFATFARDLASALGAQIEIADAVPEGMPFTFNPPAFDGFEQALAQAIAMKRRDWVLDFGSETAALLPEEAVRRFILKET